MKVVENGVLVPFDIGVVYIYGEPWKRRRICFSPLRYWGGLYHSKCFKVFSSGFSPLRYWGGLYQINPFHLIALSVLVPFDIGVVYILMGRLVKQDYSFSPLRYWGGLYPKLCCSEISLEF